MTAIPTRPRSGAHGHRDRLVRRLALRGLLFLALAELLALAARASGAPVTGWPAT
jgi:hypothetical protein